ncbi:MAG: hypothetical protein NTY46_16935 [Candidatus Sumerlaeota bacterium]|nr:hypothetical protein [Candidatus Sumerlaeota bacterium]
MANDKKTIGMTSKNKGVMEQMESMGLFKDQMDIAKFAMSVAINSGVLPGNVEGAETVWNVGSFDPEGKLKDLIPLIFPETSEQYRTVESLLNAGLEIIGKKIAHGEQFDLVEMMKIRIA